MAAKTFGIQLLDILASFVGLAESRNSGRCETLARMFLVEGLVRLVS